MALHTLGTAGTTSLVCLDKWSATLLDTDVGNVDNMLTGDDQFLALLGGRGAGATAIFGTGTTHSNTTFDTMVAGTNSAPLTQAKVGMMVLSPAFPAGTFVIAVPSGTSITTNNAATTSAGSTAFSLVPVDSGDPEGGSVSRGAMLKIPRRGRLMVFPGDVVAYDPLTGWPILVSRAAVEATNGLWTFT